MRKLLIKTEEFVITQLDKSMIEDVHKNSLDEDVRKFVPDEYFETYDDAKETVEFLLSQYSGTEGPFVYPIILSNGENIGYVQAVACGDFWEIGYHIANKYTGRGYATQAVNAFLPVIMKNLNIDKIYGICRSDNFASRRVLEKSGFKECFDKADKNNNFTINIFKSVYSL